MRIGLCFLGAVLVSGCATTPSNIPRELIGTWVLSKESAELLPQACNNIRLEVDPNGTMHFTSGESMVVMSTDIIRSKNYFTVKEKMTEQNGKPNCQGFDAEFVKAHSSAEEYFKLVGATLRYYIGPMSEGNYLLLVRE